jgi:ABC-type multidrug transport system ATPase subunit
MDTSVVNIPHVTNPDLQYTAYQLLETLGRLAQRGRTIILSLHQPRSDAFGLFSRILLLSHGSVVYSGPTLRCLPYFANLGYEPETQTNPLDFLIDVSSIDTRDADAESESRTRLAKLQRTWREAPVRDEATPHAPEKLDGTTEQQQTSIVQETTSGKRPGVLAQTVILLPRSTKNMLRAYPELIG